MFDTASTLQACVTHALIAKSKLKDRAAEAQFRSDALTARNAECWIEQKKPIV
jgi:hypothetical protein